MTKLYIEAFSGMAGDMFLSALCGLTDSYDWVQTLPEKLNLPDGKVEIQTLNKNGIVCKHVKIIDLNEGKYHTHTHAHGHPHSHTHGPGSQPHTHSPLESFTLGFRQIKAMFTGEKLEANVHSHAHTRGLKEINEIIDGGDIPEGAKKIAKAIFQIIGQSESKIHNEPIESIHFHEVSGVDSILDIVGCAVLLDKLKVEKTYCDPVCTGFGFIKIDHGVVAVPAPATADIMKDLQMYKGDEKGEKLTPTGAAILKYLNPDFKVPVLQFKQTAYGPGQKNFINPNVVRVSIVEEILINENVERSEIPTKVEKEGVQKIENNEDRLEGSAIQNSIIRNSKLKEDELHIIESNIDDGPAEYLGNAFQDQLLEAGAVDFYFTQVQMKKGRPGLKLSVLTSVQNLTKVANYILEHTTTIGVRHYAVNRTILSRRQFEMETKYGTIKVKEVTTPSGYKRHKIEYESLRNIQKNHDISLPQLQAELLQILNEKK